MLVKRFLEDPSLAVYHFWLLGFSSRSFFDGISRDAVGNKIIVEFNKFWR